MAERAPVAWGLTYLEGAGQLDVHRLVLLLARRRDLQSSRCHACVRRCSYVMLLIDKSLIDLKSLHLGHGLRVALLLARLVRALLLAHRRDLRLQIRTVAVHASGGYLCYTD